MKNKYITIISTIIFLIACNTKQQNKITDNPNSTLVNIQIDSVKINNYTFIKALKNERFYCLMSNKGDTIIKPTNFYFKAEFLDINQDGYKDIRIYVFSNTPNQCENYLFDRKLNTFRLLENCDLDIEKIRGGKYYYSYNRTGCSDMNWESYLSEIKDYKLVNIGYINGLGCDADIQNNPQTIEIYKIIKNEKTIIKKLPYMTYLTENKSKWEFIKTYWTENTTMFEN